MDEKKTERLEIRLSDSEKAKLAEKAKKAKKTVAEYVRDSAIEKDK